MASVRAANFIEKATCNLLKEKLSDLGLETKGSKPELKLRLHEAVSKLPEAQLNLHFPENLLDTPENDQEDSTNSQPQCGENLEDVNAELEELRQILSKKCEIAELRRRISELGAGSEDTGMSSAAFNFRDVEESLPQFSGDDNYCVRKWLNDFEESAAMLEWDDKRRYVYAKRLITGTAKLFLRTTLCKTWLELKNALIKEFNKKISSAEIHNKLRKRKKDRSESFQRYVLSMQEIASLSDIEEQDLVQYIIDGIPGSEQSKLLLYNANSIHELKLALQKFDKFTAQVAVSANVSSKPRHNRVLDKNLQSGTRLKCFNCNEFGHHSAACPKPKRPKGSCFKCGDTGHKMHECVATKSSIMSVNNLGRTSDNPVDILRQQYSQKPYVCYLQNEFEFVFRYEFITNGEDSSRFSCSLNTLLDSGSPISFIQQKYLPAFVIDMSKRDDNSFCGINGSVLSVIGKTLVNVSFLDKIINLNMYIVRDNTMMHSVILGRDFLKKSNLNFDIANNVNNPMYKERELGYVGCIHKDITDDEKHFENEILNIDVVEDTQLPELKVGDDIPYDIKVRLFELVSEASSQTCLTKNPNNSYNIQMEIK